MKLFDYLVEQHKYDWRFRRLQESRGFVSKRLITYFATHDLVVYGTSVTLNHGLWTQLIRPWDITR